jgi:hypothetical protein
MEITTKWPRLIVVGEPVDPEQADEILVRTARWYLSTNDREFEQQVYQTLGIKTVPYTEHGTLEHPDFWALEKWENAHGVLDLEFLGNQRIASAYIGGPHGWCDWDGTIGSFDYNIGKWPSLESVHAEAKQIAEAFPYLDLRMQFIEEEGEGSIAAQIDVADGKATIVEPDGMLVHPTDWVGADPEAMVRRVLEPHRERGVDLQRLVAAVRRVERVLA